MATFSSTPTASAFTSYSPFFSSGLLAPHAPHRLQRRGTCSSDTSEGWNESDSAPPSPSQRSSPGIPLPDESVMDVDMADFTLARKDKDMERRSATPTPHALTRDGSTTPIQSPRLCKPAALRHHPQSQSQPQMEAHSGAQAQPQTQAAAPRLRRRRSSLTQGTSPMGAIRSPARAAGNAYHLQMALPVSSRTRSGSLGGDAAAAGGGGYHTRSSTAGGVASEATSLVGRMRSGSCSNLAPDASGGAAPAAPSTARPRRALRRILTTPVPGLRAPPPTAPLPALPPVPSAPRSSSAHQHQQHQQQQQQLRPAKMNFGPEMDAHSSSPTSSTGSRSAAPPTATSARARGFSVSSSTLSGDENRIDEDVKEN
ncbi:hypothetical protein BJ912DRAFT_178160 [Pholiota molesta]|nr:hypothetical protein BJ912DRAFT_178160 [Pholiota molesta]